MYRELSIALAASFWVGTLSLACSPAATQDQKQKPAPAEKAPPKATVSLKGCVDEQNGAYVLITPDTRSVIASLQAEGFPTEGFAKHVGHTVTVQGTSIPGETKPIFKVRSIETVSDTCGSGRPNI